MPSSKQGPTPAKQPEVCRADDARILMAGDEAAAMYFWTDRLVFSVSEIPPGGRSSRDPGHHIELMALIVANLVATLVRFIGLRLVFRNHMRRAESALG